MAKIDAKVIQDLFNQIDALQKTIEKTGDEGRNKMKSIKVDEARKEIPRTSNDNVDPEAWSGINEEKQKELYQQLIHVRDSLNAAAEFSGPMKSNHIMYNAFASNTAIIVWAIVGFAAVCFLLWAIVLKWNEATGTDFAEKIQTAQDKITQLELVRGEIGETAKALREVEIRLEAAKDDTVHQEVEKEREALIKVEAEQRENVKKAENEMNIAIKAIQKTGATEQVVLLMVVLLGALGGSLHFTISLVKYIGNRQLKRSWLLYYLATPLMGAGLAPIIYMSMRIGLLNPSGVSGEGSRVANLNLIAIYSFAALTGLFSKTALDKLAEVFRTLFKTSETPTKDPIGNEKSPGGTSSSVEKSP